MRIAITTLVALVAIGITDAAYADYGKSVLAVRCDKQRGLFEVEPRIEWNERLDRLEPIFARNSGKAKLDGFDVYSIERVPNPSISCKIAHHEVRARVADRNGQALLQLYNGNSFILSIQVDDVWVFYGYVFRARYSDRNGWEELCGKESSQPSWVPLNTSRKDTNCRTPGA